MDKKENLEIPNEAIETLARCLLPAIRKYFESEQGQKEFADWKQKKRKRIDLKSVVL